MKTLGHRMWLVKTLGHRTWLVKTLGHRTWFVKTNVGAHSVRPSFSGAVGVDRAGAQYPQGVRRIRKRQSRQRLRCVRPYTRYTAHQRKARRPLPHNEQRFNLQVPAASRSEAGRAAADVYSKAKDGGTLSRYLLLCESHRRRVRSTKPNLHTGLLKLRRVLGFLGGSESGLCPPAGG